MIRVQNLSVDLGNFTLRDITLNVRQGEYFVILGPTGSGKTILLETVAGLYQPKHGQIWLHDQEVTRLEPEKRGLGFVYQDHMLFPHLSVMDNIIFGMRQRGKSKERSKNDVTWVVELLNISGLLKRKPDTLSGGERQKVAVARALAIEPSVILLDEPLSALDPDSKERVQQELRQIHQRLDLTVIHVTHDFEEAISLADRIAVMGNGQIMQIGTPEEIFRQPNSEFVARFAMAKNITRADVRDGEDGRAFAYIGDTKIQVITELRGKLHLSLRPEDILVSRAPFQSSARNSFQGTITTILDKGAILYVAVNVPPDLTCLVTRRSFEELELAKGGEVYVTFKASAVHVF